MLIFGSELSQLATVASLVYSILLPVWFGLEKVWIGREGCSCLCRSASETNTEKNTSTAWSGYFNVLSL